MGNVKQCTLNRAYTTLMLWDLPASTKERFRKACAKNKTSMKGAIETFMQDYAKAAKC